MQNETTNTIVLGAERELACAWCTNAYNGPKRRNHVYGEYHSRSHVERFWECVAYGCQRPASVWDAVRDNKDPETECLHAQWCKDNGINGNYC
jgi:hypothetical protein